MDRSLIGAEQLLNHGSTGINKLLDSGDIAILALTTCLVFALVGNAVQYWVGNRRQEKDFDRYFTVTKAINGLEGAVDELKTIFTTIIHLKGN